MQHPGAGLPALSLCATLGQEPGVEVALTYRLGVRCRFAKLRAVGLFGNSDELLLRKTHRHAPKRFELRRDPITCTDGVDRRHRSRQHDLACLKPLVILGEFVGQPWHCPRRISKNSSARRRRDLLTVLLEHHRHIGKIEAFYRQPLFAQHEPSSDSVVGDSFAASYLPFPGARIVDLQRGNYRLSRFHNVSDSYTWTD